MKKMIILLFMMVIFPICIFNCKKNKINLVPNTIDTDTILNRIVDSKISIPDRIVKKPHYSISRDYLKDKVDFKSLTNDKWKTDKIAVVGTKGVKLYKTIKGNIELCDIPKGAILHLNKEIQKSNSANKNVEGCDGWYTFNNETNYWYETVYNGKKGYIFGSYLVFGGDTEDWDSVFSKVAIQNDEFEVKFKDSYTEKLKKLSYYYTKTIKSDSFYNFNGRLDLNRLLIKALRENKIAVEKVPFEEYSQFLRVNDNAYGSLDFPDDMIALYAMLHNDKMSTTFITTDLLVHSLHLIFDRMLQDTEENKLLPSLRILTKSYYDELIKLENQNKISKEFLASINLMKKYFLVAGDLLELNIIDKSAYTDDVAKELSEINQANGFLESPLFKYKEDYSQFIPRGHYTKNDNLKKYFKAMMWFGRLHFYCVQNHPDPIINENSIKLTRAALLLIKIAKENDQILPRWHSLYNPITYIVGESDDYNLDQYIAASNDINFPDFSNWINDRNNIVNFIEKVNKQLNPPAISGNKLTQNQDLSKFSPITPRGFRFFGQRFTLDSYIFTMLSSPRVGDMEKARTMVKGLDVMAVFDSKSADDLIKDDKKKYVNFEINYNLLKNKIKSFNDNYWRNTFYRSYLRIIKEIVNFDSSMPFYFTQSDMWNNKSLTTSHAAWAELKHDTLLYAKQSAAEAAGPGPCKTWSVDVLQRPIGYIEPNLGALYWIQSILEDSIIVLSNNGFMSEYFINKFTDYRDLMNRIVEIAEYEAQDKTITEEQNELIYQIPFRLAKIVMPPDGNIIEQDLLKMAIIADVHTDADNNKALQVATGIPYRIYVALNDGNGGKRIATGYMFSYYEFEQPISDRLTDEKWKDIVYNKQNSLNKYIPEWAKRLLDE